MKHAVVIPTLIIVGILGTGLVLSLMLSPKEDTSEDSENTQALAVPEVENEGEVEGTAVEGQIQEELMQQEEFDVEKSLKEASDPDDGIVDNFEVREDVDNEMEETGPVEQDYTGFAK